ncbi:MAG: methyltransferase domain-containing protein [Thermoactinospora sp.]|nr:methyltransferase domain-containing protein [Thermoactinospora sp.]
MRNAEFNDPRLVELYDAAFGWGRDDDFFVAVAGETPGARVLDLGCGTGRVTIVLAAAGHRVTGVDPARASLDAARAKPGADRVTWIEGISSAAPEQSFDLALMTAHVAQFLLDEEWPAALDDLARALVPGGRLVFDSRDPRDRAWERWNPEESRTVTRLPGGTEVEWWTEVTSVVERDVSFTHHYLFPGERLASSGTLRFRTEEELRGSLEKAGFDVEAIYGGWERQPPGHADGEHLVIARRR